MLDRGVPVRVVSRAFDQRILLMFGTFRTILAALVVLQHFSPARLVGSMAVFAFFTLSGFLMTMLMDTTYRGRPEAFALNRFLRLYPHYWLAMAITAVLLLAGVAGSHPFIGLPDSVGGWAAALLYVNYWQTSPQLLPTAWAVTNEIVFYVLIGLGLSKTPGRTLLWFLVSLVYSVLAADYAPKNADLNYFLPSAASLPFALGALAYHARGLIDRRWAPVFAAVSALVIAATMVYVSSGRGYAAGRATVLAATAVFAVSMYEIAKAYQGTVIQKIDDLIGDLSYPIYLIHFTAAMVAQLWMPRERSYTFAIVVLIVSIDMAIIMNAVINPWINRLRDAVRSGEKLAFPSVSVLQGTTRRRSA